MSGARPTLTRVRIIALLVAGTLGLAGCAAPAAEAPSRGRAAEPERTPGAAAGASRSCVRPRGVQPIGFSATRYPNIRAHVDAAVRRGWPEVLVLDRAQAGARRARLLASVPTRPGMDRDEYPPASDRGRGEGLERGRRPRGWKASVRHVPSAENRSHGATLGIKLRRFCDGTRFRYVFY